MSAGTGSNREQFFLLSERIRTPLQRSRFWMIVVLRTIFFSVFIAVVNYVLPLGTSVLFLSIGVALGGVLASLVAFSRLRHLGFVLLLGVLYLISRAALSLAYLVPLRGSWILFSYTTELHFDLFLLAAAIAAVSTWIFWRVRAGVSLEVVAISFVCLALFAGYRNYNFVGSRRPPLEFASLLSDLSWYLHVDQLAVLVGFGLGVLMLTLAYLYFAVLPGKPSACSGDTGSSLHHAPLGTRDALIFSVALLSLFTFVSRELYLYYNQSLRVLLMNGVPEAGESGSPLGFRSALGSSNQPAAVVRLEGDYKENPFTPMLYLRESALSEFNGHEMVVASRAYDRDLPGTSPSEAYLGKEDSTLDRRAPLRHSVYLLYDQKKAFALDYPVSIQPLKNPNPGRFRGAYSAYSMVPAFPVRGITDVVVGNPAWAKDELEHYLKTYPDPRYKELAERVTTGHSAPLAKAFAITAYLSKTTIYTLKPNHEVGPQEDPVAPFLFGDHRGYCVHFAHAMVYMFRSLGIPARIGTGFLTDLSQSKDGHILLRMSDRHAWAEIYIAGRGWVPFDIQPEQVESAAVSDVDQKLLEELMGLLGPDEQILPKDVLKDELNVSDSAPILRAPLFWGACLGLIVFSLVLKLYLHYGWLIPGTLCWQLRSAHVAIAARLLDLGYRRRYAETRREFRFRLEAELGVDLLSTAELLTVAAYCARTEDYVSHRLVRQALDLDFEALLTFPRWQRCLAFFNPASIFNVLVGRRW